MPLIPIKAVTIRGSYVGNLRETEELLDLVRRKSIPAIPVTRRKLEQANETLDDLRRVFSYILAPIVYYRVSALLTEA